MLAQHPADPNGEAMNDAARQTLVEQALEIDEVVRTAVAENSLSPQSIEAAIRKGLLPLLFGPVVYWFWYCHRVFAQAGPVGLLRAFISLCTAMVLFLFLLIFVVQLAAPWGATP